MGYTAPMSTASVIGLAALGALATAGLAALYRLGARARLRLTTEADEQLWARTGDGWRLSLWGFSPAAGAPRRHLPVVLCHGLQANRFNLDFTPERSLARALSAAGFWVFVAELRGSGGSSTRGDGPHGGFEAHLQEDLPAILARVRERTGAERCLWVGHSMGGMLAYAASGRSEGEPLAAYVTVGSPGTFAHHPAYLKRLPRLALWLFPRGILLRRKLGWVAPLAGWLGAWPASMTINAGNMEGSAIRRVVYNLIGDLPADHLRLFDAWLREGRFGSLDDSEDYLEGLRRCRVPALLLAGAGDRMVPVPAVEAAAEALGERGELRILGLETGYAADYGHGDLLLGKTAPEEVYPAILDWLAAQDARLAREAAGEDEALALAASS